MRVWKIHFRSSKQYPLRKKAFSTCLKNNIIGVAWDMANPPSVKKHITTHHNETAYTNRHMEAHCLHNPPRHEDFVWARKDSKSKSTYLGRINTGNYWQMNPVHYGWTIKNVGALSRKTGIISFCGCPLYEVMATDADYHEVEFFIGGIPDFRSPAPLQQIWNILEETDARIFTEKVWQNMRNRLGI